MSAYLPDHPGSCTRLRKRKFTYSETVHPASRAFFVISPMLEALPEFYWINLLLTSICLSVSLTSVWQKTSSKTEKLKIRWILGMHLHPKPSPSSCIHSGNRSFHLPSPLCLQPVPWLAPRAFPVRRSPAMDFCCNVPSTSNYSPINLRQNRSKVTFIISLLTGRALQWAEGLWSSQSPRISSLKDFVKHFREVFSRDAPIRIFATDTKYRFFCHGDRPIPMPILMLQVYVTDM